MRCQSRFERASHVDAEDQPDTIEGDLVEESLKAGIRGDPRFESGRSGGRPICPDSSFEPIVFKARPEATLIAEFIEMLTQ